MIEGIRAVCARAVLLFLVLVMPAGEVRASDLLVLAAASLKNAMDETAALFERDHGIEVTLAYAGSAALARQIEQGLPADLFLSADLEWMDYLEARGLIEPATRIELLGNSLVLIAPAASTIEARIAPGFDLAGLLGDGRLALAETRAVPAGRYARAALENLDVWPDVEPRLAQSENVRAALRLVSLGEAPLGIVYRTDALADDAVRIVDSFDPALHPPIIYPAARLAASRNADALAFLAFLRADAARAAFERHGFRPLD